MNFNETDENTTDMTLQMKKILLLACGSYNPPTPMHLRIFGEYFLFIVTAIPILDKHFK